MCSPGLPVRDDAVFDAGVNFGIDDSAINEFVFAAVGTEADDSRSPGAGQAGYFHELVDGRGVDVDRFARDGVLRNPRLKLKGKPGRRHGECRNRDC